MRQFLLEEPGRIRLHEVPRPEPGPGEVVVRVRAALTCGTDVKAFLRGHPMWPMPTPFGHEFCGDIAAVGSSVTGWKEGDAVMAAPTAPCAACFFCGKGQENLCESIMETMVLGAYGDYVRLPERIVRRNLFAKPPHLSFAAGALMEPLACVLHGLAAVDLERVDSAVLLGAGAISLLHVLALRSAGAMQVIVVGRSRERGRFAAELGVNEVLLDGLDAAQRRVRERTQGRGADLVIECTGQPSVWEAAPGFARRGGHVILFGGCPHGSTATFDTHRFHYEQVAMTSPFHFTPAAVRRSWEMLSAAAFPPQALVTDSLPLPELGEALARHQRGEGIKFAVIP